MAQTVKNLPAILKTWVWSLSWEGPLDNLYMQRNSCVLLLETMLCVQLVSLKCLCYMQCCSLSPVWLFLTLCIIALQASLSMRLNWQEYWKGLLVPSSRRSSWPREGMWVSYISCIGRQVLYHQYHLRSHTQFFLTFFFFFLSS